MDPMSSFLLFWGGVLVYCVLFGLGISWFIRKVGNAVPNYHWKLLVVVLVTFVVGTAIAWLLGWLFFGVVAISELVLDLVVEFVLIGMVVILTNPQKV